MKEENAIEVKNITKSFKIYLDRSNNVKDFMIHRNRRRYELRKVLRGIGFEVKKGEAIGLIGHNGCGKSTTLKLLTKIMYPDSGTIEMRGRISSLIELGAGFHPDMSGRENIYINASIFGLSKKEIEARVDEIIAFSELGDYIDNPVRTYSSGMYMRLAFAVAINVDADILLIDEILAVGDANFQGKCFRKLREIKAKGTTIVIVSHSLEQIEEICERSIWIDEGVIREEGNPRTVHRHYATFMSGFSLDSKEESQDEIEEAADDEQEADNTDAEEVQADETEAVGEVIEPKEAPEEEKPRQMEIYNVVLCDKDGKERNRFVTGESATLEFEYQAYIKDRISMELVILRNDGLECYETNTFREGFELMEVEGHGRVRIHIDKLNLVTGEYWIELSMRNWDAVPYDYKEKAVVFVMSSVDRERGIAKIDHTWEFMLGED